MPRHARTTHADVWQHHADFNEQLYLALRHSPWWMISIALHVAVFVIAGLLYQEEAVVEAETTLRVTNRPVEDTLTDDEIPDPEKPIDDDMPEVEPVYKDAPIDDVVQQDVDLPFDGTNGNEGLGDAPFQGPSTNGLIGLGGSAGGAWGNRPGSDKDTTVRGGKPAWTAVEDALKWLAAHQSPNGGWEAAGFGGWCDGRPQPDGPKGAGYAAHDAGVTGLALCAFLGAGYTNRGRHPFAGTVSRGLRYLKNIQDPEGCFGARGSTSYIYDHACASLAMVEAYGMTNSPLFRASAQKALDFIALARNPYYVWRYGVKPGDNDTSVSGWMMMALKSAKLVNEDAVERGKAPTLRIDDEAFDGIRTWIGKMTDPDTGRVGYLTRGSGPARPQELIDRFPAEKSESMTAVGILARVFTGEDPRSSAAIQRGAQLCGKLPPVWNESDGSIDMYYWYYATLSMFQVGGKTWRTWNEHLKTGVIDHQRQDTDFCLYKGSWDPVGPWGGHGGRVYSTALLAMCLEVYYRYDNVFGT